jgi:hypothetical protein
MSGLEELRRLETAATPGPWAVETSDEDGFDGSSVYMDDGITWGRSYICQEMHQGLDDGQADAEFIAAARNQLPRILDALDAVLALHQPVKKWEPYEGAGYTFATEAAALEALGDVDVNSVVLEGIATNGLPFFEVCAECGRIESEQLSELGEEWGYQESLWPCATVAAITTAMEGKQ